MSLIIVYRVDNDQLQIQASLALLDILSLIKKHAPHEASLLWGTTDVGKVHTATCKTLVSAIDTIDNLVRGLKDGLPTKYSLSAQIIPGLPSRGAGGLSGIRIDGQLFAINCGVDSCTMSRVEIGPDGRGRDAETVDIRSRDRIHTDNVGDIIIERTPSDIELKSFLSKIRKFLEGRSPTAQVDRVLY